METIVAVILLAIGVVIARQLYRIWVMPMRKGGRVPMRPEEFMKFRGNYFYDSEFWEDYYTNKKTWEKQ